MKKFDLNKWLQENKNTKQDLLGQVYTPSHIASLMADMVLEVKPNTVLDPCFGEGVFICSLINKGFPKENIIGVEIDSFNYAAFKKSYSNLNLQNMDFFDFNKNVDCIIMNPPYVRQENLSLDMPNFLNKLFLKKQAEKLGVYLSSRSNLYIYFVIKAWSILEESGSLIVIMPNTWAVAEYGKEFKKFLLDNFIINKIITFNKDVFPKADVESWILHLIKKDNRTVIKTHNIEVFKIDKEFNGNLKDIMSNKTNRLIKTYNQNKLKSDSNWINIFYEEDFWNEEVLISLDSVANINRGLGTNSNAIFINKAAEFVDAYKEYFKPIICSPKDIIGYSTQNLLSKDFILFIEKNKTKIPKPLLEYLHQQELEIKGRKSPKTLYEKILRNPHSWYTFNKRNVAPILFSYIIRENKKFIFNNRKLIARDNFYEINAKKNINIYLLFAILNSNITSYFLEYIGRTHGKGLLKIQKYELDKLRIINPNFISSSDKCKLITISKKLVEKNNIKLIEKIDEILLPYVTNIDKQQLYQLLAKKEKERLEKKKV